MSNEVYQLFIKMNALFEVKMIKDSSIWLEYTDMLDKFLMNVFTDDRRSINYMIISENYIGKLISVSERVK